jgi:hypothetical protein
VDLAPVAPPAIVKERLSSCYKLDIEWKYRANTQVAYLTPYGDTEDPKRWEKEPYRVVSIVLEHAFDSGDTKLRYGLLPWTEGARSEYKVRWAWDWQMKPWEE